nr:PA2169 family four-helix-bundle protein [uncultured Allomuricauda sp.]
MNTKFEKDLENLNDLIQKNLDAKKGYQKAAENIDNAALKIFFENRSTERGHFAQSLQSEMALYSKETETEDSFASKAHRAWMDVKVFFSGNNEEAMLEEAIRGEEAALSEYEEVLRENDFTAATRGVLNAHKISIKNALTDIKAMEDVS